MVVLVEDTVWCTLPTTGEPKTGGKMKTTGSQSIRVTGGQLPRPVWLPGKWNALVNQSVHASGGNLITGPGGNLMAGNLITPPGENLMAGNLITPPAGNLIAGNLITKPQAGLSKSRLTGSGSTASTPTVTSLWVENGVIWQLPNLLVGFTSYSGATAFFSSVKSLGYKSAPSTWYAGTPFSAKDFPILHFGTKGVELNGMILIWPSLNAMPFASTFLPMLPVNQPLIPSLRSSAGPVVPTSSMGSFSANSPSGVQTCQAKYIMYAPWGPNPLSGYTTSNSGITYDMILYSWWYDF